MKEINMATNLFT